MKFDLRTWDAANHFILDFMNMKQAEYKTELNIESNGDFEQFWERNFNRINNVDISNLRIIAFHLTGTLDECREIKEKGLMNLQDVLSCNSILSKLLKEVGIQFDIKKKIVSCDGKIYNIDYDKYCTNRLLIDSNRKLYDIAHRVFYDYCVNGFMFNDDIFGYGTDIHKRPEFLMKLGCLFRQAQSVEKTWMEQSKSYKIDFYVTVDQVHRFSFGLDEPFDSIYKDWSKLDDVSKIKKWMLSHAISRSESVSSDMQCLYIKNDFVIPPKQIIKITEL